MRIRGTTATSSPTSASWLNLIERWFAEITRKRIRRGTFRSVPALIRAIEDYVTHHNRPRLAVSLDRPRRHHPPEGPAL